MTRDGRTWRRFPSKGMTLDEFAVARVTEVAGETSNERTRAVIEGILVTGFYNFAIGQEDRGTGMTLLAERVWLNFQEKTEQQQERVGLPPMASMKQEALRQFESTYAPAGRAVAQQTRVARRDQRSARPRSCPGIRIKVTGRRRGGWPPAESGEDQPDQQDREGAHDHHEEGVEWAAEPFQGSGPAGRERHVDDDQQAQDDAGHRLRVSGATGDEAEEEQAEHAPAENAGQLPPGIQGAADPHHGQGRQRAHQPDRRRRRSSRSAGIPVRSAAGRT
jgi:hypothetical protein